MSESNSSTSAYDEGFTGRGTGQQPTGVHFAMIFMTMLAVILGVIAYMQYKQMHEMSVALETAMQELRESNFERNSVRDELIETIGELEDARLELSRLREAQTEKKSSTPQE